MSIKHSIGANMLLQPLYTHPLHPTADYGTHTNLKDELSAAWCWL